MEQRHDTASSVELHAYFHLPAKQICLVESRGEARVTRLGLEVVEELPAA